jgi:hypothetical protein
MLIRTLTQTEWRVLCSYTTSARVGNYERKVRLSKKIDKRNYREVRNCGITLHYTLELAGEARLNWKIV